ncbi:hypothetical protein [Duganella violaceipulchra]|uniref:Uncharacterized protein n=1 Tax=Duganella violaceipulchra TaxID=2849652 RepID=A0AA41HD16_9BURK|nr:hypothetical protein [Duganella violaceicalia]MBV6325155.1 hypothetical protein [Duganella violaceicalia]MCP2011581.1 hypothetical protein [Duganella violaceicalia]
MAATADAGVIVSGGSSASKQAWAFKLNAANQQEWSYFRPAPDQERKTVEQGYDPAMFQGIVNMADGSVFLCASTPFSRGAIPSLFLTHLDSGGHLLSERPIESNHLRGGRPYNLVSCSAWRDGIALVAFESHWPPPDVPGGVAGASYLVLFFNQAGELQWERAITPLRNDFIPDPDGMLLTPMPGGLLVSATNNIDTEIIKLDAGGAIAVQRQLKDIYLPVRGRSPGGAPKLYGSSTRDDSQPHAVLSLNDDLSVASVVQGPRPKNFAARVVYETADGSLMLFGADIPLRASVRYVAPDLRSESALPPDLGPSLDFGSIYTACTRNNGREFVYAMPSRPDGGAWRGEASPNKGETGAVVYSISGR